MFIVFMFLVGLAICMTAQSLKERHDAAMARRPKTAALAAAMEHTRDTNAQAAALYLEAGQTYPFDCERRRVYLAMSRYLHTAVKDYDRFPPTDDHDAALQQTYADNALSRAQDALADARHMQAIAG